DDPGDADRLPRDQQVAARADVGQHQHGTDRRDREGQLPGTLHERAREHTGGHDQQQRRHHAPRRRDAVEGGAERPGGDAEDGGERRHRRPVPGTLAAPRLGPDGPPAPRLAPPAAGPVTSAGSTRWTACTWLRCARIASASAGSRSVTSTWTSTASSGTTIEGSGASGSATVSAPVSPVVGLSVRPRSHSCATRTAGTGRPGHATTGGGSAARATAAIVTSWARRWSGWP